MVSGSQDNASRNGRVQRGGFDIDQTITGIHHPLNGQATKIAQRNATARVTACVAQINAANLNLHGTVIRNAIDGLHDQPCRGRDNIQRTVTRIEQSTACGNPQVCTAGGAQFAQRQIATGINLDGTGTRAHEGGRVHGHHTTGTQRHGATAGGDLRLRRKAQRTGCVQCHRTDAAADAVVEGDIAVCGRGDGQG